MSNAIEGPVTYQSAAGGSRKLTLRGARSDDSTIVTVIDKNGGNFGLFLSDADVIDMALRILKAKAPHRLSEPKFTDTPVGTFLQNKVSGTVIKAVAHDEKLFAEWSEDGHRDDELWAVDVDGEPFVAWQDPTNPVWKIVEIEEWTKIVWTPVRKA